MEKRVLSREFGFTLVELMVAIVIIGLLIGLALPNFIGAQDRAREANLKANMRTFQAVVETYSTDWGGGYPSNMMAFKTEAISLGYWEELANPYTLETGEDKAYRHNLLGDLPTTVIGHRGKVIYHLDDADATYYIYGRGKKGDLMMSKGMTFFLSNS